MPGIAPNRHRPLLLSLALQGGGAHGAFTWGVLDRLLEEAALQVDGISATSSGAMNALAFAHGWLDGGRDGARAALAALRERVAAQTSLARWAFAATAGTAGESPSRVPARPARHRPRLRRDLACPIRCHKETTWTRMT